MALPFVITAPIAGAAGFVAGAFTPAIGRKIKALFVKLASKLVADAKAEEAKVATAITTEAKKV